MEKQEYLKQQAIGYGLCAQWQGEWGKPTDDELAQKYVRGIDFCIKHNYPTDEYIKQNFTEELRHRHNVMIDEVVNIGSDNYGETIIVNGGCVGRVDSGYFQCRSVYVRRDSRITITAKDRAKVFVRVYDNAQVDVKVADSAKVYVYRYGGMVTGEGYILRDRVE